MKGKMGRNIEEINYEHAREKEESIWQREETQ